MCFAPPNALVLGHMLYISVLNFPCFHLLSMLFQLVSAKLPFDRPYRQQSSKHFSTCSVASTFGTLRLLRFALFKFFINSIFFTMVSFATALISLTVSAGGRLTDFGAFCTDFVADFGFVFISFHSKHITSRAVISYAFYHYTFSHRHTVSLSSMVLLHFSLYGGIT